ncbi:Ig-like domain-containing protein [Allomuricauda sp. SCSIO 65647]|uniref:Ig-like domain-containing protein n=1 Tax=Allomuricauda sp. SCSIO 65647 TaxID=2908843 RepID=UPI001F3CDFF6|nr:Ig-like domain-containing protein [Muricauda sp. SCSIO 65647]UJH66086.1 Ig-like domain-containing protein [Muricauda sp. SCSIO 65647]
MLLLRRFFGVLFLFFISIALWQCARRGNPSGGPKDESPPVLLRTDPENFTTNFEGDRIRLYFDEYIKLEDVQNQMIVSPPLKNQPVIMPQGGPSKYIEITIKDTLQENTTYTINFGQSIVDNNEGNPNSFLTYVFSTGDYLDSLQITGLVKDAFKREPDDFISVMLYEIDSIFNDSTIYKYPPNYITNTLDSTPVFQLKNLKAGKYALVAIKDAGKNNVFDQRSDKIGFLSDTVVVPTDSLFLLSLFKEVPDYAISVPSYVAKNKIIFGYQGPAEHIAIKPLTELPDSVRTIILKERDKDTLNYWLTPTDLDSIVFTVVNEQQQLIDTFTVKRRKLELDSLKLSTTTRGKINFGDTLSILASTPIVQIDTSKISGALNDSIPLSYGITLDTLKNQLNFEFLQEPNQKYSFELVPGAITDFFGMQNDTLKYGISTGSYADYGNLRFNITGAVDYPAIVQLINDKGETQKQVYMTEPRQIEFNHLTPAKYGLRLIFDDNGNQKWDTGNYLKKIQPEKVRYYPDMIDVRANWELEQTFTVLE